MIFFTLYKEFWKYLLKNVIVIDVKYRFTHVFSNMAN